MLLKSAPNIFARISLTINKFHVWDAMSTYYEGKPIITIIITIANIMRGVQSSHNHHGYVAFQHKITFCVDIHVCAPLSSPLLDMIVHEELCFRCRCRTIKVIASKQGYYKLFINMQTSKLNLTLHDWPRDKILSCESIVPKTTIGWQIKYMLIGFRLGFLDYLSSYVANIHVTQELIAIALLSSCLCLKFFVCDLRLLGYNKRKIALA